MIKSRFYAFVTQKLAFAILLMSLITPSVANAGVFSFVANLFNDTEQIIIENYEEINSQNMALLTATVSYNSTSSIGGGGISIDKSALLYESGPNGTNADIQTIPNSDKIATYIVRGGDTLGQIAEMFGVSVGTVIWANDIKQGDLIRKGQILSILPIDGIKHIVKTGDTLASIVKKYGGDLKETRQYNDLLDSDILVAGDEIMIPNGEAQLPVYTKTLTIEEHIRRSQVNVRGTGGPEYKGYYIRPIVGGRISQWLHGYNAIDFAAPMGTPILASAPGQVIISKDNGYWNGGYGNYVVIKHGNGTQTLYSHNSKNIVWQGQSVVQGQVIGYIGSTGRSTGPHVHFEVRGAKNPWENGDF